MRDDLSHRGSRGLRARCCCWLEGPAALGLAWLALAACAALPLPAAAEFRLETSDQWNGAGGYDAVSADLDGDGKTDYVTARNGPNGVHINQGGGVFHQVQALGSGQTRDLAVGDVDGDGDGDIVAANQGQNVRVWVQNDQGRFTTSDSSAFSYAWAVSLADFNRDGNLDAFLATFGNNAGRVLKGHGDGTFTDQGTIPGSYDASDVAVGKFDGDADMDIAVATGSGEPISIKENTGAPSTDFNFTEATTFLTAQSGSIDVGDITGDGYPDIVVDNSGGEKCWAKNDGAGNVTFSVKDPTAPDEEPCGNLVDVDGANELDVVLPKDGGNKVYTNDGTGTFSDTGQSLGGLNTYAIAPIDADGDSDRDFLAVGGGVGVALWDNDNGDAQFSSAIQPFGQSNDARAVDLADMDGDGDRDAVLGQKNHLKRLWSNDAVTFSYSGWGRAQAPRPRAWPWPTSTPTATRIW